MTIRASRYQDELTPAERIRLQALFAACEPVHYDDPALHDYGNHRALYEYLATELRFDCEPTRGAAYRRAKILLGE